MSFDASAYVDELNDFEAEIGQALRPAAQAGAQVLYDEARSNVRSSKKGHWFHGKQFRVNGTKYYFEAGTLRKAIYQAFSPDNSKPLQLATYHVSWREKDVPYGHMVEYGTSRAPAHSFLRKAGDSHGERAEAAMEARFDQLVGQKLAEVSP